MTTRGQHPNSRAVLLHHQKRGCKVKSSDMAVRVYDAVQMHNEGVSIGIIAKKLKVGRSIVYKYLRSEGLPTKRRINRENIVKLYRKEHLPPEAIAARLGLSRNCVVLHIRAEGLIA